MTDKHDAALMLTLSNLAYLLPVFILIFKSTKLAPMLKMSQVPLRMSIPLIFLLFYTGIVVSWGYHACSSDLAIQSGQDLSTFEPLIADSCSTCQPQWHSALTWTDHAPVNLLHFMDVFVSMFVMFVFFTYLVPIRAEVRHISMIFAFMWIFFFTALGTNIAAAVPILVAGAFFVVYWYYHRHESKTRNVMWTMGIIFTLAAFTCYIVETPYFILHQLWHIFGGISSALLVSCIVTKPASEFPNHKIWKWLFDVTEKSYSTDPISFEMLNL